MHSEVQRTRRSERPVEGLVESSLSRAGQEPGSHQEPAKILLKPQAVIVEPHPTVQAVLEYLLIREGYAVDTHVEVSTVASEQKPGLTSVLLLVGVEDGDGLYVVQTRDLDRALATLTEGAEFPRSVILLVFGIHAFGPKLIGTVDILRVVRAVGGFDGCKKGPPREKP